MGTLASILLPAIPALIKLAEAAIPTPGQGETRMGAVIAMLRRLVESMCAAGQIPPGPQITDDKLQGIVESVFQQLKATGQLTAPQTGSLFLLQGTVTALKAV